MTGQHHLITEDEIGVRLDKLLTTLHKEYSRQQIQTWIKNGYVHVNNKVQKANYRCKLGDEIVREIPLEPQVIIKSEHIPLTIVYEDNYLLVINKPKGMLVHPTDTEQTNTLVNGLKYHTSHLSDIGGGMRPGIVHRLDRETSGVMVVAKDNNTHVHLQKQFKKQSVIRIYEAIVTGEIAHDQGVIKAPIGRNPHNRIKRTVVSDGKYAETHFQVIKRFSNYTHVQCELKTGRTHQIRVHMKYMNHPIVGDELYNDKKSSIISGQALFAKQLQFIHPHTEKWLTITVEEPTHFKNVIQKLTKMA